MYNIKEYSKLGTRDLTEEEIELIWQKAKPIEGLSGTIARFDPCGAIIFRDRYLCDMTDRGWGIDHINPSLRGKDEETMDNLRPMQVFNIESKGDSYPRYRGVITSIDGRSENVEVDREFRVRVKELR